MKFEIKNIENNHFLFFANDNKKKYITLLFTYTFFKTCQCQIGLGCARGRTSTGTLWRGDGQPRNPLRASKQRPWRSFAREVPEGAQSARIFPVVSQKQRQGTITPSQTPFSRSRRGTLAIFPQTNPQSYCTATICSGNSECLDFTVPKWGLSRQGSAPPR